MPNLLQVDVDYDHHRVEVRVRDPVRVRVTIGVLAAVCAVLGAIVVVMGGFAAVTSGFISLCMVVVPVLTASVAAVSAVRGRGGRWARRLLLTAAAVTALVNLLVFATSGGAAVWPLAIGLALAALTAVWATTASPHARPRSVVVTPSRLTVQSEQGTDDLALSDVREVSHDDRTVSVLTNDGRTLAFGARLPHDVRQMLSDRIAAGADACRRENAGPPKDLIIVAKRASEAAQREQQ